MRKISLVIILITIFAVLGSNVLAWDDCPFGLEDDPYPGICGRYIDTNNDGICDHSQSKPEETTINQENQAGTQQQQQNTNNTKFPVMLLLSFIIIIALIIFFRYLKRKEKLSDLKEKIIWNILLLIFFIPSAVTGVVLLLSTNLGLLRELGLSLLQIHNVTSLFFMWVSAYHIIWHTSYYIRCTKKLLSK